MKSTYNDTFIEDYDCPVCEGRGCSICKFMGVIQVSSTTDRQQPINDGNGYAHHVAPKIVIEAEDYEKDQLITQMGRLRLVNLTAQKEYAAALTVFKQLQDIKEFMDETIPQKMYDIVNNLKEDKLVDLDPIANSLDLLHELRKVNLELFEGIKRLSLHFEMSLEVMNRAYRETKEKHDDDKNELEKFRTMLFSAQARQMKGYAGSKRIGTPSIVNPPDPNSIDDIEMEEADTDTNSLNSDVGIIDLADIDE